jgi:hypothetical protein
VVEGLDVPARMGSSMSPASGGWAAVGVMVGRLLCCRDCGDWASGAELEVTAWAEPPRHLLLGRLLVAVYSVVFGLVLVWDSRSLGRCCF